jgi:hypothetical protein
MKQRDWNALAEELTDLLSYQPDVTAVEVIVCKDGGLELCPTKENDGRGFHHMGSVVDFCRCKRLSSYVMVKTEPFSRVICGIF